MNDSLRTGANEDAAFSSNFAVLALASCVIATLGLLENSVAVIIGAMVVAPLMNPIAAFAFAALDGDVAMVRRALLTLASGVALAFTVSAALAVVAWAQPIGSEIVGRTRPNLLDLAIAIAAGGVAGFARVRPAVANTIAGTAIAVALMPPVCVAGILAAHHDLSRAEGALLLFGTNFAGIALACMLVYRVAGAFRVHSRVGLLTTVAITATIAIPLALSSYEIVREAKIESDIRNELTSNTVTFRQARLVAARFDWYSNPASVEMDVRAASPISPSQVGDLEEFVRSRTGLHVRLVLHVSRFATVTDDPTPDASEDPLPPG